MSDIILYDYPKSSASYRVRIALNLAGLPYQAVQVNLLQRDHKGADHLARNPQGLVPVLEIDGHSFTQSLAILDYLDQTRDLGLLPQEPARRARVQALAYVLAVDLHPVCNLSVATHATGGTDPAHIKWMQHFIRPGLLAFEALLAQFPQDTPFTTGPQPALPDLCLIPQLYNADRWEVDYTDCPRIRAVQSTCATHPGFAAATPEAATPQ
ncbi:maleylacetoacetate isomerase [Rhodophyticola sp. CCM32]|uniref:maleylacetoacetate isomerase n=1 Tax=Rhodophyticola sp. CCM32 TaxID=2916397 RepID=UPI00107F77FF|nr:maleylacetoacetate isomerase [Rhodophyticola sp. CCM32]QBX99440.1 maleylacetoacetate isomerase [Rhodophyticola sp. CCM32]